MKTVLILTFLPLVCFPPQISAHPRLPGRLRLRGVRFAGPARGHAADPVAEPGRGAAAQAGPALLGRRGRRLLLQPPRRRRRPAATQGG